MNGISALMKQIPESSLALPPGEVAKRRIAVYEPKRVFIRHQTCWGLDHGLLAFRTVRNKRLLFKISSLS